MPAPLPVQIKTINLSLGPNFNVVYPQTKKMENPTFENFINRAITYQTHELIYQQMMNMSTPLVEMDGIYELKNNQRNCLSLTLSNYAYHYQAAHGMTYLKALTFDIEKGNLCELPDLFKSNSDYIRKISDLIKLQIKKRNIPLISEFTSIQPDQDFYIADKTLVIYFQLYELTPYYFGFPIFPISVYDIQEILDENSPLGRMATNN